MSNRYGTGPNGYGLRAGRHAGHCNSDPDAQSREQINKQGFGGRRGGGHGRRHRFFATGLTGRQRAAQLNQQPQQVEPQMQEMVHGDGNIVCIDPDLCMACGACVKFCPAEAIAIESSTAIINIDKCINGATCIDVCPTQAIYLAQTPNKS